MRVRRLPILAFLMAAAVWPLAIAAPQSPAPLAPAAWITPYRETASRLIKAALADDFAWRRLAELTDRFGHRFSGSENYTRAAEWAMAAMRADGFDSVRAEPVMVPRWVRGAESADITHPGQHPLAMLGLGGTVATPPGGLEADVLVVTGFDDLRARAVEARGRIVLFNVAYSNYSETVTYRTNGARAAAQYGAVATLVRSVGPIGLRTPHTGSVNYVAGTPPIPAAALAAEDANRIARLAARGERVTVRLLTSGRVDSDVLSTNVVGELRGRERPEEIVLVGGHFDSWDVGTGASDDGVGCIVTWEAVRLLKQLGIRPRRTIRVVLFANEENGLRGANAYAERYATSAGDHVFALESDSGVFGPATLGFSGSAAARSQILQIGPLLAPLGMQDIGAGGGGADIGPIAQAGNVPTMAYLGDASRYFVIHHSAADTVERITPDEVARAAAAIAVVSYVVAEMPERLPR
jgi:carboxypeptidase Q